MNDLSDGRHSFVRASEKASETVRALNHATRYRTIPAPLAYAMFGELAQLGYRLAQLLDQIGAGLETSLTEYDVYDHNRDPAESVAMARAALAVARGHAWGIGEQVEAAQAAISLQGYHLADDTPDDTPEETR